MQQVEVMVEQGGTLGLGYCYLNAVQTGEKSLVKLRQQGGEAVEMSTKIVGEVRSQARSALSPQKSNRPYFYKTTGLVIGVDEPTPEK